MRALGDATAPGIGTSPGGVTAPALAPRPPAAGVHPDAPDVSAEPFRLGYRPQLDGVRGIAVLLVVTYRIGAVLWSDARFWLAPGGVLGLDVFFVLSGFLITSLLLDEADRRGRVGLGGFAVRRLRRLVPAMVGLSAFLLAISLAGKMYEPDAVLHSMPTVFTFTHNWAISYGWDGSLGHLWSVAVEAQFYLVWAVATALVVRLTRRPHVVLAALSATGIVAVLVGRSLALSHDTPVLRLYMGTPWRLDGPLMGALVAVVASAGWLRWFRGRTAVGLGAAGLALLGSGPPCARWATVPVPRRAHAGRPVRRRSGAGGGSDAGEPARSGAGPAAARGRRPGVVLAVRLAPAAVRDPRQEHRRLVAALAGRRRVGAGARCRRGLVPTGRAAVPTPPPGRACRRCRQARPPRERGRQRLIRSAGSPRPASRA